ncbi:MAG: hypothetical protein IMZ60_03825 [Actinobacteria bacterium]|nr:hypothetical protein [Actinomycetota bacterium]
MTHLRQCDKCYKEVPSKTKFYRIVETFWDGKKLKTTAAGDLCENCYKEIRNNGKRN